MFEIKKLHKLNSRILAIVFIVFYLPKQEVFAQMETGGLPISKSNVSHYNIPYYYLPPVDFNELEARENAIKQRSSKISLSAYNFDVEINIGSLGLWIPIDRKNVWILKLKSDGASALGFIFENFNLQQGEKLYIYNNKDIIGAFTSLNNTSKRILATRFIQGDEVTIEFSTSYEKTNCGTFTITSISHDYKSTSTSIPNSCYVNINCEEGDEWQVEKRAVCKIRSCNMTGCWNCTGTLINNTEQDAMPYLLTANHCVSSDYEAERTTFYFNYESPSCEGNSGYNGNVLSGSSVGSTLYENDFSLLKLQYQPPMSFKPYYCGWSIYTGGNLDKLRIIHQPGGEVKKISGSNVRPSTATYVELGEPEYAQDGFWLVKNYDFGITEGGSSGSSLLDLDHRIVGTLTGGDNSNDSCVSMLYDYYSKFSESFHVKPNVGLKMSALLDPQGQAGLGIGGYDPFPYPFSGCDTISNIAKSENKILIKYDNGKGYYSGHNADSITQFAEKYDNHDSLYLYGAIVNIKHSGSNGTVIFRVYSGENKPEKIAFEKLIPLQKLKANTLNYLEFYPNVKISGSYFIGYQIIYEASDTFTVIMAEQRPTDQPSNAFLNTNGVWTNINQVTSGSWGSSFDIRPVFCKNEVTGMSTMQLANKPNIYPNPSPGIFNINTNEEIITKIEVLNLYGKLVLSKFEISNICRIDLNKYPSGIYIIRMYARRGIYEYKIIKI